MPIVIRSLAFAVLGMLHACTDSGPAAGGESDGRVFPRGQWETATPESQGLDRAALAQAFAALPTPANEGPLIVVANGRIVFTLGDVTAPEFLFSCSKAVTGMVAAKQIADGAIASLDEPVPNTVPGAWTDYPGDASIRMFLTMTSDYGLPEPRRPGERYAYNNHGIDFLGEYLSRTFFGIGPDRMDDVVLASLLHVTSHEDDIGFKGQWGGWYGGLKISARDAARLGLLLLRGGEWSGKRVLAREFVDGLFRLQLPDGAVRYASGTPDEDSMWNQQAATDRLTGSWSFGLWRAGDEGRPDDAWQAAALEGFRGKRILLCPPGSLPDSSLEVVLVCLPHLPDEGPDTGHYLGAITGAVIRPTHR